MFRPNGSNPQPTKQDVTTVAKTYVSKSKLVGTRSGCKLSYLQQNEGFAPMKFEVLSIDYDQRIECFMVSARVDYEWYLEKTQGAEHNLSIQRDIIKGSKNYRTLRADLKKGCVLPAIVIAAKDIAAASLQKYNKQQGFLDILPETRDEATSALQDVSPDDIYIVDGLQRTNALREARDDLSGDELASYLARSLRVEIWINIPFYSLAYRMLLLNAGQKPMSMKHQIDILSRGLMEDLRHIPGLEIFTVKDHKRRVNPGQFHLSVLAQAFQAWLQKSPNVEMSNLIAERLVVDDALDSLGSGIGASGDDVSEESYHNFVAWLIEFDQALGSKSYKFLGNDTVVLGIAAAVGFAIQNEALNDRVRPALQRLIAEAKQDVEDPMGLERFDALRRSIDTKKSNVGEATREFVFKTFREYIMQGGASNLRDCWQQLATML